MAAGDKDVLLADTGYVEDPLAARGESEQRLGCAGDNDDLRSVDGDNDDPLGWPADRVGLLTILGERDARVGMANETLAGTGDAEESRDNDGSLMIGVGDSECLFDLTG